MKLGSDCRGEVEEEMGAVSQGSKGKPLPRDSGPDLGMESIDDSWSLMELTSSFS